MLSVARFTALMELTLSNRQTGKLCCSRAMKWSCFEETQMGLPRWIGVAGLIAFMLVMVGCSPTMVTFDGPPGTVMFVDNKPYHLPAAVELWRPAGVGQSNRYNVSLNYSTEQVQDA